MSSNDGKGAYGPISSGIIAPQDLSMRIRGATLAYLIALQVLVNFDSGAIAAALERLTEGFNLSLTESVSACASL